MLLLTFSTVSLSEIKNVSWLYVDMLQCLHPPWPSAGYCTLWCVDFSHITLLLAGGGEDSCHRAYYSDGSLCSAYELCNTRAFEYNAWQWQRCRNSKLFIPRCRDSIRNPPMPSLLLDHKELSQTKYVSFCRCTWWKWLKIQGGGSW